METDSSITTWIGQLREGQAAAAQKLWERFFPQLVQIASEKLRGMAKRDADEEDIALSAFHSFYRAATSGRIPQLANRDDLWRTLVLITSGKAIDRRRYQLALKRHGGKPAPGDDLLLLKEAMGNDPDPAFAALIVDECQSLLLRLKDEELRRMALFRLEGHTVEEIAQEIQCSERTVKRRLALIRRIWEDKAAC